MTQENNTQASPKKIAIMGSGAIGMELLSVLHNQYPDTEIVVWNRESETGVASAITGDQREAIRHRLRRGNGINADISFTTDLDEAMRGADIVAITGGVPRTNPKQLRSDLAVSNIDFIDPIAKKAKELEEENSNYKPNYFIGTNPVGLIDQHFQEISGIPHNRVAGLSGELDVERLEQSIRLNLGLSDYDSVRGARVLGDHGPNMVPVFSQIEVKKDGEWKKLLDLPEVHENNDAMLKEFKEATVKGGGKVVAWTTTDSKKGQSDFRAPAAAIAYMIEQLVDAKWGDKEASLPITASTFHKDSGIYSGQTIKFNEDGTHNFVETPKLSANEAKDLEASIANAKQEKGVFDRFASTRKEMDDFEIGYQGIKR